MTSAHSHGKVVSGGNQADGERRAQAPSACPECDGRVTTAHCESVCADCGLVVGEQRIDHGPEWRSFTEGPTNPKRTGAHLTQARHDLGLSTEIGKFEDGQGNDLPGAKRRRMSRLRYLHRRGKYQSKAERNLGLGFTEIARIVGVLGLPDGLTEQASVLFRTAQDEDLLRGRSIEGMAAGSVYASCRCRGLARPIESVGAVAQVEEDRVVNAYDVLNVELGLAAVCQRPRDFLPRLAAACETPDEVRQRALELAEMSEETGVANGCRPSGVAAACLYRAAEECGWHLTQATVADAANTTPVTVRARDEALVDAVGEALAD